jgi:hypothetical protein
VWCFCYGSPSKLIQHAYSWNHGHTFPSYSYSDVGNSCKSGLYGMGPEVGIKTMWGDACLLIALILLETGPETTCIQTPRTKMTYFDISFHLFITQIANDTTTTQEHIVRELHIINLPAQLIMASWKTDINSPCPPSIHASVLKAFTSSANQCQACLHRTVFPFHGASSVLPGRIMHEWNTCNLFAIWFLGNFTNSCFLCSIL